jgi:hypothetical protein
MDEEASDDKPPTPLDVARRALILSGVACRASIESYADEGYRRETAGHIHDWLDELSLWSHLEPYEEEILRAPFGALPSWLRAQGTWFVEGLALLAWSLRRCDFPPHSRKVDPIAVTDSLDFLSPDAGSLLDSPALREAVELKAAREWFYDAHCTLRHHLFRQGDGRLAYWIGQYVGVLGLDPEEVLAGDGLAFDGAPLTEADRGRLEDWEHVVSERHRAAIWLKGEYPLFTELPVDT